MYKSLLEKQAKIFSYSKACIEKNCQPYNPNRKKVEEKEEVTKNHKL